MSFAGLGRTRDIPAPTGATKVLTTNESHRGEKWSSWECTQDASIYDLPAITPLTPKLWTKRYMHAQICLK